MLAATATRVKVLADLIVDIPLPGSDTEAHGQHNQIQIFPNVHNLAGRIIVGRG
jgi:hypothetical protein